MLAPIREPDYRAYEAQTQLNDLRLLWPEVASDGQVRPRKARVQRVVDWWRVSSACMRGGIWRNVSDSVANRPVASQPTFALLRPVALAESSTACGQQSKTI